MVITMCSQSSNLSTIKELCHIFIYVYKCIMIIWYCGTKYLFYSLINFDRKPCARIMNLVSKYNVQCVNTVIHLYNFNCSLSTQFKPTLPIWIVDRYSYWTKVLSIEFRSLKMIFLIAGVWVIYFLFLQWKNRKGWSFLDILAKCCIVTLINAIFIQNI